MNFLHLQLQHNYFLGVVFNSAYSCTVLKKSDLIVHV